MLPTANGRTSIPPRETRAIVAGLGALGSEVVRNLGLLQCGAVFLADPDGVEAVNMGRSSLLRHPACLGRSKVEALLDSLRALFPQTEWEGLPAEIADVPDARFRDTTLLFSCVDTDLARTEMALLSARFGVPVCDAGLGGTSLRVGRVTWLPGGVAACFSCLLTLQRRAALLSFWESDVHACWTGEVLSRHNWTSTPTMAGIIAGLQVETAFHSMGKSGFSITADLDANEPFRTLNHARSAGCPFHGAVEPQLLSFPVCALAQCRNCGSQFNPNRRIAWLRRRGACRECGSSELTVLASGRDMPDFLEVPAEAQ